MLPQVECGAERSRVRGRKLQGLRLQKGRDVHFFFSGNYTLNPGDPLKTEKLYPQNRIQGRTTTDYITLPCGCDSSLWLL